jgi:hypothetical protein
LLAACLGQALDEFVDVARLGQVAPSSRVVLLGLGQAFVALAGLDWPAQVACGGRCGPGDLLKTDGRATVLFVAVLAG